MKIVYISNSIIPSRTANSIHVMKMCNSWARMGHDVTLIAPERKDKEEKGIDIFDFYEVEPKFKIKKVQFLYKIRGAAYFYGFKAALIAKKINPDIVYGRFLFGVLLASLLNIPSTIELHHPFFGKKRQHEFFFKLLLSKTKNRKIVVITNALKQYFLANYQLSDADVLVAHDGADQVNSYEAKNDIRKNELLNIGYVGQLYKGKGMEIISELSKRYSKAHFHIVGGYENDIEEWKQKTMNSSNITYYGFIPHSETGKYINACDVMIAPYLNTVRGYGVKSDDENLAQWMSPLKIFEYMAHGKAIVTSDLPVLKEILEDGVTGLFCSNKNVEDWLLTFKRIENNNELLIMLGENARNTFIEEYTWDKRASKIISFIDEK